MADRGTGTGTKGKRAVLISCFNWYEGRLKPLGKILEDTYDVTVLLSDFDHGTKKPLTPRSDECVYVHVPEYKKNLSAGRLYSHLSFGRSVARLLRQIQPDLIYLLLPPNNTARHCLNYTRRYPGTKYIIDLIDLWPESMPLHRLAKTLPARWWAGLRDSSLRAADCVFTECELYRTRLKDVIPLERSKTLYLFRGQGPQEKSLVREILKDKQNAPDRKDMKDRGKRLALGYLGSINYIIDIEGICAVVRALRDAGCGVDFHVVGDGEAREKFLDALNETGCSLHYHGLIFDPLQKLKILGRCDYGLNMMRDFVSVGLTIKSVDYLSMGLPLINNIKGDTWALVERFGAGVNISPEAGTETEKERESFDGAVRALLNAGSVTMSRGALSCYDAHFTPEAFERSARTGLVNVI